MNVTVHARAIAEATEAAAYRKGAGDVLAALEQAAIVYANDRDRDLLLELVEVFRVRFEVSPRGVSTGTKPSPPPPCGRCGGDGRVLDWLEMHPYQVPCPDCDGRGVAGMDHVRGAATG